LNRQDGKKIQSHDWKNETSIGMSHTELSIWI